MPGSSHASARSACGGFPGFLRFRDYSSIIPASLCHPGQEKMNRSLQASLRVLLAACLAFVSVFAAAAEPSGETLKSIKARDVVAIGFLTDAIPE